MNPSVLKRSADRPLFFIVAALVVVGFFVFSSASLGLLARDGASVSSLAFSQLFLGIGLGSVALFITSRIHYRTWKFFAPYIFIGTLMLSVLVFVPHIGFSSGGATRWLAIGPLTLQPAELLKIGFVLYFAAFIARTRTQRTTSVTSIIRFVIIVALPAVALLLQPDTSTVVILVASGLVMYFVAGARWRDIAVLVLLGCMALAALVYMRPYVLDRIETFLDPAADALGSGYQIQQSLIAIGSGGVLGRGFGQSVQKFGYLPEPVGDSIFAVAAEEFGFVGSMVVILLFVAFVIRSLYIAVRAPDYFGALVVVGMTTLIGVQAFINIAAMLGTIPLSGLTLPFMSHGGTAMLALLASVGIILNVSKYIKT